MKLKLSLLLLVSLLSVQAIMAQTPQFSYSATSSNTSEPFGTGTTYNNYKTQIMYMPGDFGNMPGQALGTIKKIYFLASSSAATTIWNNFMIRVSQVAAPFPNMNTYETTGFTTVLSASTYTIANAVSGTWVGIPLQTPFVYDPNKALVIEISQTGKTLSTAGFNVYGGGVPRNSAFTGNTCVSGPIGGAATAKRYTYSFGFDIANTLANNASISVPAGPTFTFCPGATLNISVKVNNLGSNRLNSIKINWKLDNIIQPSINYLNTLDTLGGSLSNSVTYTMPSLNFSDNSIHNVSYYVSSPNGSTDADTKNDTVSLALASIPAVRITPSGFTSICVGDTVNVTLAPTGNGSNYTWRRNGAIIQVSGLVSSYVATTYGTYAVTATVNGCTSTDSVKVESFVMPIPMVSPAGPHVLCTGDSVVLQTSSSINGAGFQWLKDGSPIPGAISTGLTALSSGVYTVLAGKYNCNAVSADVNVAVKPTPQPHITYSNGLLSTDTAGNVSYQWYVSTKAVPVFLPIAGATQSTYKPTEVGDYSVKSFNGGCYGTSSSYTLDTNALAVGTLNMAANINIYPNPASNEIYVQAPAGTEVFVSGMDGRVLLHEKTAAAPLNISALADGVYIIRVTDRNNTTLKTDKLVKASH